MEGIELEQAIELLTAQVKPVDDVREVLLLGGLGSIVAENYFAKFDNPPFNRSPLDGYAVNSADTPNNFKVVGEECAGDFWRKTLKRGEALRIMTGAAIPKGTDCVVRQEDIIKVDAENIFVPKKLQHHENFCFAGEDVKSGDLIVEKGTILTAAHVAVLASQGYSLVKVYRFPSVTIASTGDELLMPYEKLAKGKIYNSNLYLLQARVIELDVALGNLGNLPDDPEVVAKKILEYDRKTDLLITTGGVSVGKKDIMHEVVKKIGEKIFWRVNMKPGAPVIGWRTENFLCLSLSGNPFAAFATFELLARPIIAKLNRRADFMYKRIKAVMADNFPKQSRGRRFIRAKFDDGKIYLPEQHASGSLFSAVDCNALVDIPAGTGALKIGDKVEVVLL
ncbi:MAG: molybdopterin molybdotransferase MoeA [Selenomonadaceae bacterium]|nr:molybdopterin molybdotransferase MoeA [Selenomonadaceae bacterium]